MRVIMLNSIAEKRSTGQIMYELYSYLKEEKHEIKFCYGRGASIDNPDFIKIDTDLEIYYHIIASRITGLQGYYSTHATNRVISIIKEFKPEIVILGNIHGYYLNSFRLLNYLKDNNIYTVYYMFDEYAFLGKCAFFDSCDKYKTECHHCPKKKGYPKSYLFDTSKKIFRDKMAIYQGFRTIRFVSVPYTVSRAKESALFKKSNAVVYPFGWGIDTNGVFKPTDNQLLRRKLKIPESNKVVLAVAPFSNDIKGISAYYYPIATRLKNEAISFIHVGFDGKPGDAPDNIITVPFVKKQEELAGFFSLADLFVIPSISEGYPTVCLDSLSCGTPICGFNISGTPYVASEPQGVFVAPFDVDALCEVVKTSPKKTDEIISRCREYAENNLDSRIIFGKLLSQIKMELNSMMCNGENSK